MRSLILRLEGLEGGQRAQRVGLSVCSDVNEAHAVCQPVARVAQALGGDLAELLENRAHQMGIRVGVLRFVRYRTMIVFMSGPQLENE